MSQEKSKSVAGNNDVPERSRRDSLSSPNDDDLLKGSGDEHDDQVDVSPETERSLLGDPANSSDAGRSAAKGPSSSVGTGGGFQIQPKINWVTITERDNCHPSFSCLDQEILIGGMRTRPKCQISNTTLMTLFGDQSRRQMAGDGPVNHFRLSAHQASVLMDPKLGYERKEKMLYSDQPYFTVPGLTLAISLFREQCVHFRRAYDAIPIADLPFYENPKRDPWIPDYELFQAAWRRARQEPCRIGVLPKESGPPLVFAPSLAFVNLKSCVFDEATQHFYNRLPDCRSIIESGAHGKVFIIGIEIPSIHVFGNLMEIHTGLSKARTEGFLIPPPIDFEKGGANMYEIREQYDKMSRELSVKGETVWLNCLYPLKEDPLQIHHPAACLGISPRRRKTDPLNMHQLETYLKCVRRGFNEETRFPSWKMVEESTAPPVAKKAREEVAHLAPIRRSEPSSSHGHYSGSNRGQQPRGRGHFFPHGRRGFRGSQSGRHAGGPPRM